MIRTIRTCFLILFYSFISIPIGLAFAQGTPGFENARQLNKQEVLDLISNKTVSYHATVGTRTTGVATIVLMKTTFKKTEDSGGTLSAYAPGGSSDGKWQVNDNGRLVRQYERVAWGNKPFSVGVFENNGKYHWKIGEEFQELIKIE